MWTKPKLAGLGLLALTVSGIVALRGAPPELTECEAAAQWVEENIGNLPTTYAEFAKFPLTYRKTIYSKLPVDVRASLWRANIDNVVASRELTTGQADFLHRIASDVEGLLMVGESKELDRLTVEARALLGDDLARLALANIGPVDAAMSEACSCSSKSDWCPGGYGCGTDGDGCDTIEDECGTFWAYDCNGECLRPE